MLVDVLLKLHSDSSTSIYSILNSSIFVTDLEDKNKAVLFHTGFRFATHNGNFVDIYYDLKSNVIVRHPHNPSTSKQRAPHLIGCLCTIADGNFITHCYDFLITSINVKERENQNKTNLLQGLYGCNMLDPDSVRFVLEAIREVKLKDDSGAEAIHSIFKIFDIASTIELTLNQTFDEIVFFNHRIFQEFIPS